jgi:hypothetical protein
MFEKVKLPEIETDPDSIVLPLTANLDPGDIVPTPKLPLLSKTIFGVRVA